MVKKYKSKSLKHKGGAIYTFDLNDKIGGLPAYTPLNGTRDGDCPSSDTKDLGFVNYGIKRGGRRNKKYKKTKKSKSKSSKRSRKH